MIGNHATGRQLGRVAQTAFPAHIGMTGHSVYRRGAVTMQVGWFGKTGSKEMCVQKSHDGVTTIEANQLERPAGLEDFDRDCPGQIAQLLRGEFSERTTCCLKAHRDLWCCWG
jgi:hypothetical protein